MHPPRTTLNNVSKLTVLLSVLALLALAPGCGKRGLPQTTKNRNQTDQPPGGQYSPAASTSNRPRHRSALAARARSTPNRTAHKWNNDDDQSSPQAHSSRPIRIIDPAALSPNRPLQLNAPLATQGLSPLTTQGPSSLTPLRPNPPAPSASRSSPTSRSPGLPPWVITQSPNKTAATSARSTKATSPATHSKTRSTSSTKLSAGSPQANSNHPGFPSSVSSPANTRSAATSNNSFASPTSRAPARR